jgi:hypothetical protein
MVWKTYREIEGLGFISSGAAFTGYAWNAWWKYKKF